MSSRPPASTTEKKKLLLHQKKTHFPAALRPALFFPLTCFTTLLAPTAAALACFAALRRRCFVVLEPRLRTAGLFTASEEEEGPAAAAAAAAPNSEVSIVSPTEAGGGPVAAPAAAESVSIADLALRRRAAFFFFLRGGRVFFREAESFSKASTAARFQFLRFFLSSSPFTRAFPI